MTLGLITPKVTRNGDGNATSFSFPFVIFNASDLQVIHIDAIGVETILELGINYSITPAGAYPSVGSITYPLAGSPLPGTESLVLLRATPKTQETKLRNQGGYFAEVQEMTFDRLTAMIQEIGEEVARSVKVPAGSAVDVDLLISTLLQSASIAEAARDEAVAAAAEAALSLNTEAFLGVYDLTGQSSITISDLGDSSSALSLRFAISGVTVSDDSATLAAQVTKNGLLKTDGSYFQSLFNFFSSDTNDTVGVENATSMPIMRFIGNAAGEIADGQVVVDEPHSPRKHLFRIDSAMITAAPDIGTVKASCHYNGTDAADPLDAVTFLISDGTMLSGTVRVYGLRDLSS